jgi:hypothetical protein
MAGDHQGISALLNTAAGGASAVEVSEEIENEENDENEAEAPASSNAAAIGITAAAK